MPTDFRRLPTTPDSDIPEHHRNERSLRDDWPALRGLFDLGPDLEECAEVAMGVRLDDMRATLPELEIHAARHAHREVRLFMS